MVSGQRVLMLLRFTAFGVADIEVMPVSAVGPIAPQMKNALASVKGGAGGQAGFGVPMVVAGQKELETTAFQAAQATAEVQSVLLQFLDKEETKSCWFGGEADPPTGRSD